MGTLEPQISHFNEIRSGICACAKATSRATTVKVVTRVAEGRSMIAVEDPDGDAYNGDEWEGEPNVEKPEIELERVHPLANATTKLLDVDAVDEVDVGGCSEDDFDAEKSSTMSTPRKNSGPSTTKQTSVTASKRRDETSRASLMDIRSENDNSSCQIDATSADQRECFPSPSLSVASPTKALDLVSVHGHSEDHPSATTVLPPAAPSATPSTSNPDTDRQLERLRVAEISARIAAKRIAEFREAQAQREAQLAVDAAAQKKARQKFRTSNQKIYQQMGIAHLTGEQRYQLLIEEKKLKKVHDQAKLKLEKQQRWYNVKRVANADKPAETPAHMEELKQLEQQNLERWHRDTIQRRLCIKQRQAALRDEAKTIINTCTRSEYVRGSYLLEVATATKVRRSDVADDSARVSEHEVEQRLDGV